MADGTAANKFEGVTSLYTPVEAIVTPDTDEEPTVEPTVEPVVEPVVEPTVTTSKFEGVAPLYTPAVEPTVKSTGEPTVRKNKFEGVSTLQSFQEDTIFKPLAVKEFFINSGEGTIQPLKIFEQKYENKPLIKEQILNDPDLMEIVYLSLEGRFKQEGITGGTTGIRGTATYGAGGTTGRAQIGIFENPFGSRDYRKMPKEKAFEIWQNYQRSFDNAHSVTVGNEIAYTLAANDRVKRQLAGGYLLFNQMDNVFTGEGSWGEMFDAIYDGLGDAIWDPVTAASFGFSKVLQLGAKKAGMKEFQGFFNNIYKDAVTNGATKKAAALAVANTMTKAAPMATLDATFAVGQDLARQFQLIDVDVQEDYSKMEAAFAAAGSIIFPLVAGGSEAFKQARKGGIFKDTIIGYKNIDKIIKKYGAEEAWERLGQALDKEGLFKYVDDQFKTLTARGKVNFLPWEENKAQADRLIASKGEKRVDPSANAAFFKYFWFGDPENGVKGYFEALNDAGFVMHPEIIKESKITGSFARTIRFINPATLDKAVRTWERETGYVLDGVRNEKGRVTPELVEASMVRNMSLAGENLWIVSEISRLRKAGLNGKQIAENYKRVQPTDGPAHVSAAMSMYKRLLTSHYATTGANLKGFQHLVTIDQAADMFVGAINLTRHAYYRAAGNADKAQETYNQVYGAWGGAVRRLADAISPEIPMEYANEILERFPQIEEKIMREVSADGGTYETLKLYNLDDKSFAERAKGAGVGRKAALEAQRLAWKGADAYTKGAQTITFAVLQDTLTKRWAFGTNLNSEIMKKYGITPEEFFSNPDVEFIMAKPEFRELLEKAAYKTGRQTASVNWSTLPATNFMRNIATGIEWATNRTVLGYQIPFGSFANTTMATAGDLSGINTLTYILKRNNLAGMKIDPVTDNGADQFAKAMVGWGTVLYGVTGSIGDSETATQDSALERVKNGLTMFQDPMPDGTIRDREFEWPASFFRASSQAIAHGMVDTGEESVLAWADRMVTEEGYGARWWAGVPEDVKRQVMFQAGPGQVVRDFTGVATAVGQMQGLIKNEDWSGLAYFATMGTLSKIGSGVTRHLEPVNIAYGILNDAQLNQDLRQGNRFFNQGNKYLNNLFNPPTDTDRRATATRGYASGRDVNIGKQMGVRMSQWPNLVESLFNHVGEPVFAPIRWDGPPKVKNYMDGMVYTALKAEAEKLVEKWPDFKSLTLEKKKSLLKGMKDDAKASVIQQMESGGQVPQSMLLVRKLYGQKKKTQEVLKLIGPSFEKRLFGFSEMPFDEKIESLLEMEDGYNQLLLIENMVDGYDRWNQVLR